MSTNADAETRQDLRQCSDGLWVSRRQLGFRYLRTEGEHREPIMVDAIVRPVAKRAAFACSDEKLNRIWATAAYTLRSCMQRLMIDGIKRDRMPWMGDQALSTLCNAFAFGDGDIVRDSLTALGRPQCAGYINGISNYSLWWVVNHFLYQRYFDDRGYLRRQADHIDRFVASLAQHTTSEGVFRPPTDPRGFNNASAGSIFIDWGVQDVDNSIGRPSAFRISRARRITSVPAVNWTASAT